MLHVHVEDNYGLVHRSVGLLLVVWVELHLFLSTDWAVFVFLAVWCVLPRQQSGLLTDTPRVFPGGMRYSTVSYAPLPGKNEHRVDLQDSSSGYQSQVLGCTDISS